MDVNSKSILSMIARRFDLKRSTIDDRLQLQKLVYLLQATGVQLGYGFCWFKYGPYSQDLADDAYAVLSVAPERYKETENWKFDGKVERKLQEFKNFCSEFKNDYQRLELLASIDFMCRIWGEEYEPFEKFSEIFKDHKKKLLNGATIEQEQLKKALALWKEFQNLN